MQEHQEPLSLDVLYDLALSRLDAQVERLHTIDDKIKFALGAASIVLPIALGFLGTQKGDLSAASVALLGLAGVVYLVIVVLGVKAYYTVELRYPPRLLALWQDALFWEAQVTRQQILAQVVTALEDNSATLRQKARDANLLLGLLPTEVVLALMAIAVAFAT